MATKWYLQGLADCMDQSIDMVNDTLKFMLVNDSYTFDTDHTVIDNGADDSTDPSYNEITATNYTGGYGGAGRKTATVTRTINTTNDRIDYSFDSETWSSLGGASNDTVAAAILVKEITNDTASRLIAYIDFTDKLTSGNDITLNMTSAGAGGNLRISIS